MNLGSDSSGPDFGSIRAELEQLASLGAIPVGSASGDWLRATGIGHASGDVLRADEAWLRVTLPAHDAADLLRRSLIRDPKYRFHLDLTLAEVLCAIAKDGRWQRVEELLFGPFRAFAPRFVSLLEAGQFIDGARAFEVAVSSLRKLSPGGDLDFESWDEEVWSGATDRASLFTVLEDLYLPIYYIPVFVTADGAVRDQILLAVCAAHEGAAARIDESALPTTVSSSAKGVPLRWRQGSATAVALVGGVQIRAAAQSPDLIDFPGGLPEPAAASELLPDEPPSPASEVWDLLELGGFAMLGVPADATTWPETKAETARISPELPAGRELDDLGRPRRHSPHADDALVRLAEHPFFGLWMQVLLLEALDRELGEETLILAPPAATLVQNIERSTRVLYQPRRAKEKDVRSPMLELGLLDEVFIRVFQHLGVHSIYQAYSADPWSRGLHLLHDAGLVKARHDRWAMAPHVVDRLHGGGMMSGVIRRGRAIRDRFHDAFEGLWSNADHSSLEVALG